MNSPTENKFLEGGERLSRSKKLSKYTRPKISIITVTYNSEQVLKNCIESVIHQPFNDIELIVIDGFSTDNTVNILLEYDTYIDYWRSEPDKGIYNAMNKAVKYAQGDWIIFLGSDDELLPGFSDFAPLLNDSNCIYYGDFMKDGKIYGGKFNAYRLSKSNICHQNIFYPREVFSKYQYQEKYLVSADYYLNMQCWLDAAFKFKYKPITVAKFSALGFSGKNKDVIFELDREKNVLKHLGILAYIRYKIKRFRTKKSNNAF